MTAELTSEAGNEAIDEATGLPVRPAGNGTELQCPACQQWRPAFVIAALASDAAVRFEADWGCDNERSMLAREARAAAEAAMPTPERRFSKPEFLDLWTPAETVAVMQSTDPMMSYFWARTLAWDGVFLLSDTRVIAGTMQAVALGILTQARADRIRAGLPPL